MKPRYLGITISIVSLLSIIFLFWLGNSLNHQNIENCEELCDVQEGISCSLDSCPFSLNHRNNEWVISVLEIFVAFIGGIGFYLTLTKEEKLITEKKYNLTKLNKIERNVFLFVKKNKDKGTYQSSIVETFNFPKTKVTRILDKLENQDLIERKRRGMSNLIILK